MGRQCVWCWHPGFSLVWLNRRGTELWRDRAEHLTPPLPCRYGLLGSRNMCKGLMVNTG